MAELMQLKCPNCSGPVEWAGGVGAECPHCGSRFLVPTEAAEQLACPKCGKVDRVQKASAACQTDSRLRPPQEPSRSDEMEGGTAFALGVALAVPFSLIAALLFAAALWEFVGYGDIYGLIALAGLFFVGFSSIGWVSAIQGKRKRDRGKRRYAAEKEKQERATRRWERLYYCARDDGVFIPGETPFIPIDRMQEFLYAE